MINYVLVYFILEPL